MNGKDKRTEILLLQIANGILEFVNRPDVRPYLQRLVLNYVWEHFVRPKKICLECQYPLVDVQACPCCGRLSDDGQILIDRAGCRLNWQ